ncbi:MAG: archaetidylserine decarboxylase [Lysobacterales bacterium]
MAQRLYLLLQHLLPHHLLTALARALTRIRWRPLKNWQIRAFARRFDIDLAQAESAEPDHYPTFDAFFTRALKPGARTPDPDPASVLMPADGRISAAGRIQAGHLFQAKGRDYSLATLLGDEARAADFADGDFATVYLQPRNYHRVHMPWHGRLRQTLYIPGRLYSVAPVTVQGVDRLFARNERLVCHFDTDFGPMAVILVGAMLVAGVETVWQPGSVQRAGRQPEAIDYRAQTIELDRFAEMGRFHMGSTAIVLFPPGRVALDHFETGQEVAMGQRLGWRLPPTA